MLMIYANIPRSQLFKMPICKIIRGIYMVFRAILILFTLPVLLDRKFPFNEMLSNHIAKNMVS